MMQRAFCVLCVVSALVPGAAWAQDEPTKPAVQVMDMQGADIDGARLGPGQSVAGERRSKTSSLIKVRQDFVPELMRSVEEL